MKWRIYSLLISLQLLKDHSCPVVKNNIYGKFLVSCLSRLAMLVKYVHLQPDKNEKLISEITWFSI